MKKTTKKVLLGAATVAAALSAGQVAQAATTNVKISAVIVQPVSITQTATLNFGSLTETANGTATVDNLGARTVGGGVHAAGGTVSAGGFTLKGAIGRKINVTATTATVTLGTTKMAVDQFTISGAAGTINATAFARTLAAATETGFDVGGRLSVVTGVAPATYTGTIKLNAVYN